MAVVCLQTPKAPDNYIPYYSIKRRVLAFEGNDWDDFYTCFLVSVLFRQKYFLQKACGMITIGYDSDIVTYYLLLKHF